MVKGWKQIRKNKYNIAWRNDYNQSITQVFQLAKPNKGWMARTLKEAKRFKTKSQALKFARNYIKRHPDG